MGKRIRRGHCSTHGRIPEAGGVEPYIEVVHKGTPLREHLDQIAMERVELYRCRPPEGLHVPIMVTAAAVDGRIP